MQNISKNNKILLVLAGFVLAGLFGYYLAMARIGMGPLAAIKPMTSSAHTYPKNMSCTALWDAANHELAIGHVLDSSWLRLRFYKAGCQPTDEQIGLPVYQENAQ